VVVGVHPAGEEEGDGAHGAPGDHREDHAREAAARTAAEEELGQLPAGGVAAADDHGLEGEPGKEEAPEPRQGRARLHGAQPRQASTRRSKGAPPRTGSATGRPRRRPVSSMAARAASSASPPVLSETPAQRMAGLTRAPRRSERSTISSMGGTR